MGGLVVAKLETTQNFRAEQGVFGGVRGVDAEGNPQTFRKILEKDATFSSFNHEIGITLRLHPSLPGLIVFPTIAQALKKNLYSKK